VGGAPAARPTGGRPGPAGSSAGAGRAAPAGAGGGGAGCCLPSVEVLALDPSAAKWNVGGVHGTSTGAVEVRRSGNDLSQSLAISYTLSPGSTAVAGVDYQALSGSVTIPAGRRAAVLVTPLDNASADHFSEVGIVLAASPDYTIDGGADNAWVQITERAATYPQPHVESMPVPQVVIDNVDWGAAELPGGGVSPGAWLLWRQAFIYPWETDTNTAAVTVNYAVSGSATPGADYAALPGAVTLPQDVFAAVIPLTPADDGLLEGPEDVWVTPTPSDRYVIAVNTAAAVEIYSDESGEDPVASDDTYAMSAGDVSLTIPADGVLCNDVSYGDGTLTAGPGAISTDLGGTVSMNADGGFTYMPTAGLRSTGGTDSFAYTASYTDLNGVQHAAAALVTLFVVKVDLQMAGVDPAHKLDVGGFVPINANNDNRSDVTNEIPKKRDDTELVDRDGKRFVDNDLKPVNIVVNPNVGLPGFFVLSATNSGVGQIKLWTDNTKPARAEGTYTQANLPSKIYVEGTEPGAALKESEVRLTYLFVNACGLPIDAGADSVKVSVTPVIDFMNITTGTVNFFNQTPPPNGPDGRLGMGTFGQNGNGGAVFDAQVNRTGVNGDVIFIHNVLGVDNNFTGAGGAFVFTAASGIPNLNFRLNGGANYPLLDLANAANLPRPDYDGQTRYVINDATKQLITANDSPGFTLIPDPRVPPREDSVNKHLTQVDFRDRFRLYLVWRFPAPPGGGSSVLYTIGFRDWNAVFRANMSVLGRGVTNIVAPPSGVFTDPVFSRKHDNPVVVSPIASQRTELNK
jgi:hypothetical protein